MKLEDLFENTDEDVNRDFGGGLDDLNSGVYVASPQKQASTGKWYINIYFRKDAKFVDPEDRWMHNSGVKPVKKFPVTKEKVAKRLANNFNSPLDPSLNYRKWKIS